MNKKENKLKYRRISLFNAGSGAIQRSLSIDALLYLNLQQISWGHLPGKPFRRIDHQVDLLVIPKSEVFHE